MTGSSDPMVLRATAAQATLDKWSKRPFKLGTSDCVRMVADHLRRMHRKVRLPASGSYRTVNSALKALKARGFDSLAAALDDMGMERIAPAAALVGDIIMLPGVDQLGALTVALGNGRVVGWHDDVSSGAVVMQPVEFSLAWRVC